MFASLWSHDVDNVLQHARVLLYFLASIVSFGLMMILAQIRNRLAQGLSVVFGCWALNAGLWFAVLRCWMATGQRPVWHEWGATVNALFLVIAPVAIWVLFRRAVEGKGDG